MIHIHFRHRENAPPLRVVHRTCVSPPLSPLMASALANMSHGPLRLEPAQPASAEAARPMLHAAYRGRQRHLRITVASLVLRDFARPGRDGAGNRFVEITPAGLALIEGAQPCLLPLREKVPAQQADVGEGKP